MVKINQLPLRVAASTASGAIKIALPLFPPYYGLETIFTPLISNNNRVGLPHA